MGITDLHLMLFLVSHNLWPSLSSPSHTPVGTPAAAYQNIFSSIKATNDTSTIIEIANFGMRGKIGLERRTLKVEQELTIGACSFIMNQVRQTPCQRLRQNQLSPKLNIFVY